MTALADLPANMQTKIAIVGDCWEWTGSRNPKGYGSVTNGRGGSMLAHRKAYQETVGEIPDGMQLDHLCKNTSCVNPAHLEPVTNAENMRRRYHVGRTAVEGAGFMDIFDRYWGHLSEQVSA